MFVCVFRWIVESSTLHSFMDPSPLPDTEASGNSRPREEDSDVLEEPPLKKLKAEVPEEPTNSDGDKLASQSSIRTGHNV